MRLGWEYTQTITDKHTAHEGGLFVRLKHNGDRVVGAFCGEPLPREVHWNGQRYEPCTGEGCSLCADEMRPTLRVGINFYVTAEGRMKIIEGGSMWIQDVLKLREKYGLDEWLFEVTRKGDPGDPKTKYSILPEERISEELKAEIANQQIHDLIKVLHGSDDDDPRIDSQTAMGFIERLKMLPEQNTKRFLNQFRVERVRDLKVSDLEVAQLVLGGFEEQARIVAAKAQTQPVEVDPFA